MRAGVPHLLPIDHPFLSVKFGSRDEPGQIRAGGRFAEELAPRLFAGEDGQEEPLAQRIGAVGKDGWRRQRDRTADGDPDSAGGQQFVSHDIVGPCREILTEPTTGPRRGGPSGQSQLLAPFDE